MKSEKSVIKNSLFLYVRMIILMGIGFYTSRVLLEALGVENLGIYNVVGSLILVFDFVSSSLSNSTQRFINLGLGQGNAETTRKYFSQSLVLHVFFALIIIILAESFGTWFIYNKLQIPDNRLFAAVVVFHLTVISVLFRLVRTCFDSDIIAREEMSYFAYISILEGLLKLFICFLVINSKHDKLIVYALLFFAINVIVTLCNIIYCYVKFPETHFKLYTDKKEYKLLMSFIGINSFGAFFYAIGTYGIDIILNIFFGPIVNGAKGLASTIDRVVKQFGYNIDLAVRPRITTLFAQDESSKMVSLAMKSSKYEYFVIVLIAIPFVFQTDTILSIWLKEVPDYTKVFVQIMMCQSLAEVLGLSFNSMSMATGKIKNIQIYGRLLTLSALPISYIMLKIVSNPYLPIVIITLLTIAYSLYMVYDTNKNLHFGIKPFFKKVLIPVVEVTAAIFICCNYLIKPLNLHSDLLGTILECLIMELLAVVIIIILGTEKEDRENAISVIKNKIKK